MIIAHRGASWDAPENTLAAFRLAWEQGADAIEADVHLSRDGEVVVIHDLDAGRTGGRKLRIKEHSIESLRQLDFGRHKGEAWSGERIPRLDEVIATLPEGGRLVIEIKADAQILPPLKRILGNGGLPPDRVTLIAFNAGTIEKASRQLDGCDTLWLCAHHRDMLGRPHLSKVGALLRKARAVGAAGLNVQVCPDLDAEFIAACHEANMMCWAWTVNDPAEATRLREAGIDAITTDRPGLIRETLFS